jgi:hypothetical protein
LEVPWDLGFGIWDFDPMRINNSKHVPWIIFVFLATLAACILYVGNFHPARLPSWIHLPASLIQSPTEHHTVGGTPLGLWFGSISLVIFIFAVLLSLRKKIPLWRVGTVQRWLRAHIWLTILTIPLVILHSGFRFGGGMTTFLMVLYGIVMVSGFYGLFLQHIMPRLMKERLPAETVFEQIPHIRSQLAVAAEKMRDSFKPAPPKKPEAAAPAPSASKAVAAPAAVMASTKGELSTPVARAKSATGSAETAAPVVEAAKKTASENAPAPPSIPNAPVRPATPKVETIGTPTARVQSDPPGAPVARSEVPAGDQPAPSPPVAPPAEEKPAAVSSPAPAAKPPPPAAAPKPAAPVAAKPAVAAPKPAPKPATPADPASEAVLIEFIERQILPYLQARRGDRMRLNNPRFSDDTFRFVKLRVSEGYRSRVEEIQGWCDERRMLDVQVRLHHWLHGWLFVHVPFSFLLLMLTIWHACVTLFYY